MSTLQTLTLKRTAALGRLAKLHQRAERLSGPEASVVSALLRELDSALEETQVAIEQMQAQLDELAGARHEAENVRRQLQDFADAVPLPCLWTTRDGAIEAANPAAAELLNVSMQRLSGRPLMLFLANRQAFEQASAALNQGISRAVELDMLLRPRERRPRAVRLSGRRLGSDVRHCWFITSVNEPGGGKLELHP